MKGTIVALAAFALLGASLQAEPFEEAQVTETINLVSLLRQLQKPQPATIGDVIKGQTALKTGGDSRAELKFPDLTITRVGSNSLFRFYAGGRDMTLDGGTMLFYSPKGAGGGKVQAGAVTAAVTGSAIIVVNLTREMKRPYVWVICAQHSAVVSGDGFVRKIYEGQAIDHDGNVIKIDMRPVANGYLMSGFSTPPPFAIRGYPKGIVKKWDVDTANDQIAQIARRTILGNQPGPITIDQPTQSVATQSAPLVVTSTNPAPKSFSPAPTPAPTPRRHRPHRPPRPPPEEGPPKGGEGGEVSQRRGR
jgi:FecR protein